MPIRRRTNKMEIMKRILIPLFIIALVSTQGCNNPLSLDQLWGGGDDDDSSNEERPSVQPSRVIEPTQKFSVATGGVAPGRDELVLYDEYGNIRHFVGDPLSCTASDEGIVKLEPRPDYETVSEGSGVRIVAQKPGVTAITCVIGDIALDEIYEVTIPPQPLIQILIAEAGLQLADEADLDENYDDPVVKQTSASPTANAIASVIRNRIELINSDDDPSLFEADEAEYDGDPPVSYYDAVISADDQFSPSALTDPTHGIFVDAERRDNMYGDWTIAYDQAVIAAAGVFNGDIDDTTGVSFAFRSPTEDEWGLLSAEWNGANNTIPEGSGFTDESFPKLSPIQILIHPDVWTYDDGRPAFVFARTRGGSDTAITNTP